MTTPPSSYRSGGRGLVVVRFVDADAGASGRLVELAVLVRLDDALAHAVCPITVPSSWSTFCSAAARSVLRAWSPSCEARADLTLDPPLLQLKDAHPQDQLLRRRPLLRGERDVRDERPESGVVLGERGERIVEVLDQVVAGAAKQV